MPPVEVEIGRIELGHAFEPAAVEDRQLPVLQLDQLTPAQLLQGSVGMHHCQAEAFRPLALGERELVAMAVRSPHQVEPRV